MLSGLNLIGKQLAGFFQMGENDNVDFNVLILYIGELFLDGAGVICCAGKIKKYERENPEGVWELRSVD